MLFIISSLFYCILQYSLEDLKTPWLDIIRELDRTNTVVGLLGLKTDKDERTISKEEASLFAKTRAIDFYIEVTSRKSDSLLEVYELISQQLLKRQSKLKI